MVYNTWFLLFSLCSLKDVLNILHFLNIHFKYIYIYILKLWIRIKYILEESVDVRVYPDYSIKKTQFLSNADSCYGTHQSKK